MSHILFFIVGFLFCRFLHNLYVIGSINIFMSRAVENALKLLGGAAENMAYMRQLKYQTVENYGDKEHLKVIKNTDDHDFNTWKLKAIQDFKECFPSPYDAHIPFNDWDGAMRVLDDIYKAELIAKIGEDKRYNK